MSTPLQRYAGTVEVDPDEEVDLGMEWGHRLADGDAIASAEWVAPAGVNVISTSLDGTVAIVRISLVVAGQSHTLTNRVTLASGQKWDSSLRIDGVHL